MEDDIINNLDMSARNIQKEDPSIPSVDWKTKFKWQMFNYVVLGSTLMGVTLPLSEWNFVCFVKGWKYTNASVSRVLAEPSYFPLTLTVNIISLILLAIPILMRNIQIHVYFVNESFSLCWRYFNLLSLIMIICAYIGMILMTIYDVHNYPVTHIIYAGILIGSFWFYQLFHTIITLRFRYFMYAKNFYYCYFALYFIDGIFYLLTSLLGLGWTIAYVVAYQSTDVNIYDEGDGIDKPYYAYQWIGIWFLFIYYYGLIFTIYNDSTDDEVRLFFKYKYLYITKGLYNVNFCDSIRESQPVVQSVSVGTTDGTSNDLL